MYWYVNLYGAYAHRVDRHVEKIRFRTELLYLVVSALTIHPPS